MSASLAFSAQTANRTMYFPLRLLGTMWSLPLSLMLLMSVSLNLLGPTMRKHTSPISTLFITSKRRSCFTRCLLEQKRTVRCYTIKQLCYITSSVFASAKFKQILNSVLILYVLVIQRKVTIDVDNFNKSYDQYVPLEHYEAKLYIL